jgi:hypothetical protein
MKTLIKIIVGSLLAGVALGAAVAYVEVRPWAIIDPGADASAPAAAPTPTTSPPRAEFPEKVYNFGKMERGTKMSHAFQVRNIGHQALKVNVVKTTCKCTVGDLEKDVLQPNEESDIVLEWTARTGSGPFRHSATIGTNDPQFSQVELTVEGEVVESSSVVPPELVFTDVPVGQSSEARIFVMSHLQPEVKVLDYKFESEELASHMDVKITPAEMDELPSPEAQSGVKVSATYQAGKTIGRDYGWLELTTNLEKFPELSILVVANTVGDISVYGPGWVSQQGLLNLGAVRSGEGKRVRLNLNVRGERAASTIMEVTNVDPPELKATLGEPKKIHDQLYGIPLFVEIPEGTPPMARIGEPASTDAQITLKSNNPDAAEVQLKVHFTVEL